MGGVNNDPIGWTAEEWFSSLQRQEIFNFCSVQTGSGTHPAFCSVDAFTGV
jgi:hypothetical protein